MPGFHLSFSVGFNHWPRSSLLWDPLLLSLLHSSGITVYAVALLLMLWRSEFRSLCLCYRTLLIELLLPTASLILSNAFLQHESYFPVIFLFGFILILFLVKETQQRTKIPYLWVSETCPKHFIYKHIKTIHLLIFHMYECLACMYICVPGAGEGQKRAWEPLEL